MLCARLTQTPHQLHITRTPPYHPPQHEANIIQIHLRPHSHPPPQDDYGETVAAQLAAAAAAGDGGASTGVSPAKSAAAGGAAAGGGGGGAAAASPGGRGAAAGGAAGASPARGVVLTGLNPFSDRLPLLSLAAQQQGIVWSKMPPSVASSPAVSVTEGSAARHMLLGAHKVRRGSAARVGCGARGRAGLWVWAWLGC